MVGTNIKSGAIVNIKSVQNDTELFTLWDGNFTSTDFAELDLSFAQANGFTDEIVVLSKPVQEERIYESTSCIVQLLDAKEFSIVNQHFDVNLLDTCRLATEGLVIPIKLQQHVKVLVKIERIKPSNGRVFLLTKNTEMQFMHSHHDANQNSSDSKKKVTDSAISLDSIGLSALKIGPKLKFPTNFILICGERGSGKTYYMKDIVHVGACSGHFVNCKTFIGKKIDIISSALTELMEKAIREQPSTIGLDNIEALAPKGYSDVTNAHDTLYLAKTTDILYNFLRRLRKSLKSQNVLAVCTCTSPDELDDRLSKSKGYKLFDRVIYMNYGDNRLIFHMMKQSKPVRLSLNPKQIELIASKCSSFAPSDLKNVLERGFIHACSKSVHKFDTNPMTVELEDILQALDGYKPINTRGVCVQEKTSRTFDFIGGMDNIKRTLKRNILNQIKYGAIFSKSVVKPRNNILLYGPPGCGKTLIAEALMNDDSFRSICVRGPELLSKYIGGSEAAIRDLFRKAHLIKPCMIFFDEFESLVSKRGADSTGVTDRIVNQFLTLMDGKEELSRDIFILAASSRPNMIDPAILRPGRMDQHIYCPLPDEVDRLDILHKLSREILFDFDKLEIFPKWASNLQGFTGADLQALLHTAQLKSLHEQLKTVPRDKIVLKVRESHLAEAFEDLKPDVETRAPDLLHNYPRCIAKMNKPAATRATLA